MDGFQQLRKDIVVKQPNTHQLMVKYATVKKMMVDNTSDIIKGLVIFTLICKGGYSIRFH